MQWTYSDPKTGRRRLKPRYAWMLPSFAIGFVLGFTLTGMII